jgi:hypothetical protein
MRSKDSLKVNPRQKKSKNLRPMVMIIKVYSLLKTNLRKPVAINSNRSNNRSRSKENSRTKRRKTI